MHVTELDCAYIGGEWVPDCGSSKNASGGDYCVGWAFESYYECVEVVNGDGDGGDGGGGSGGGGGEPVLPAPTIQMFPLEIVSETNEYLQMKAKSKTTADNVPSVYTGTYVIAENTLIVRSEASNLQGNLSITPGFLLGVNQVETVLNDTSIPNVASPYTYTHT